MPCVERKGARFRRGRLGPIHRVVEHAEFAERAGRWRPGEPIPVIGCPELDRFVASGPVSVPGARERRPGMVVSVGVAHESAHLLAAATSRGHQRLETAALRGWLEDHADETIALVALPDDLGRLDFWPGDLVSRLGLVTAANLPALTVLVLRTVLSRSQNRSSYVLAAPGMPQGVPVDSTSFTEFFQARPARLGLLTVTAHGRECCVGSVDGIICGAPEVPLERAVLGRAPACLRGGGCFRRDLDGSAMRSARDIDALVVMANACLAVSVGIHAYPAEVNVGLGFLSGTAVAVVGPVGVHVTSPFYGRAFQDALAEGMSLGDALAALNELSAATSGPLGRFGLLGDPALVPFAVGASGEEGSEVDARRPADVVARRGLRTPGPLAPAPTSTSAPAPSLDTVIRRIRALARVSVPVDDGTVANLVASTGIATPTVVDEAQRRAVRAIINDVQSTFWDLLGAKASHFVPVSTRPARCPSCGRSTARHLELRHVEDPAAGLTALLCSKCGDLEWATHSDAPVVHTVEREWLGTVGASLPMSAVLLNRTDRDVRAHLGFACVGGFNSDIPTTWQSELVLPARSEARVEWTLDLSADFALADEHRGVLVSMVEGVSRFSQVYVGVARRGAGALG